MMDIAEIYKTIGPAGTALVAVACAAVYFALKNYIYLYIVWRDFRRKYPDIEQCGFGKECMDGVEDNPLACIVHDIVQTHAGHSEDIRAEVAYLFHRNFEQVTRELCYLRLISVMSPMLGLLGTIFGMVAVFQTIGQNGAPDAALLATGIYEALVTTIMGLCVAIPSLMLYYFLMLRFKGFHIEAVEHSYRALERVRNIKAGEHSKGELHV
jgi:biopolymer transport protein ExbB